MITKIECRNSCLLVLIAFCSWTAWPYEVAADEIEMASPGLLDLHATEIGPHRNVTAAYWGNNLSLGVDADFIDSELVTSAFGAYYRTARSASGKEFVVGVNADIDAERENSYEIQFQHQLARSFGYGVGMADLPNDNQRLWFAKLTFAKQLRHSNIEFNPQVQAVNGNARIGLHAIHYTDNYLAGGGHDGEQLRLVVGYVSPNADQFLRPAGEIFQWNSDVGSIPGGKLLFVNGSLRYSGAFLSNAARKGRILGAGGVSYDNPVSYLSLGWNRTPGIWEIGDLWNVRWVDSETRESGRVTQFQTAFFPNHLRAAESKWDGAFVGFEVESISDVSVRSALLGYFKRFDRFSIGLVAKRPLSESTLSLFIGFRKPMSWR